jgi:hypothetical protein
MRNKKIFVKFELGRSAYLPVLRYCPLISQESYQKSELGRNGYNLFLRYCPFMLGGVIANFKVLSYHVPQNPLKICHGYLFPRFCLNWGAPHTKQEH